MIVFDIDVIVKTVPDRTMHLSEVAPNFKDAMSDILSALENFGLLDHVVTASIFYFSKDTDSRLTMLNCINVGPDGLRKITTEVFQ